MTSNRPESDNSLRNKPDTPAVTDSPTAPAGDVITVVTGLGRCGSSLVMRMLAAGGLPIVGDPISGEDMRTLGLPEGAGWVRECRGRAMKVLNPHRSRLPFGHSYRFIWLDRDVREQAKSCVKILKSVGIPANRDDRQGIEAGIKRDRRPALGAVRELGPVLVLAFERLLETPAIVASEISQFCGGGLDVLAMASEVLPRSPRCLDYVLERHQVRGTGDSAFGEAPDRSCAIPTDRSRPGESDATAPSTQRQLSDPNEPLS